MTNAEKYRTAEERQEAFSKFCGINSCTECPLNNKTEDGCCFLWLELEEKKPLHPCPFCGGDADVFQVGSKFFVRCIECGATPHTTDTEGKAIELWNRRAR